jgi:NADH:ubiquinone oxidoreductase subunit 6 (subunit J)
VIDGFENTRFDVVSPSTTAQVSDSIFSQYIVPFEAASVLLLAALIGAIVIARKD